MAFACGIAVGCSFTLMFYIVACRMVRRCNGAEDATASLAERGALAGTRRHRPEALYHVCDSMEGLPELEGGSRPLSVPGPVSKRASSPTSEHIVKFSSPIASPLTAMHARSQPCQTEKTERLDVAEGNERKATEENKLKGNGEGTAYTLPLYGSLHRPVVFNNPPLCSSICDVSSTRKNTVLSKQDQQETGGNTEETMYASPPNTVSHRPVVIDDAPLCSCNCNVVAGSSSSNSTYLCMKKSPQLVDVSPVVKLATFSTPAYGNVYRDTIISPVKQLLDDQYEVMPDDHYEVIPEHHSTKQHLPFPTRPPPVPDFPLHLHLDER